MNLVEKILIPVRICIFCLISRSNLYEISRYGLPSEIKRIKIDESKMHMYFLDLGLIGYDYVD